MCPVPLKPLPLTLTVTTTVSPPPWNGPLVYELGRRYCRCGSHEADLLTALEMATPIVRDCRGGEGGDHASRVTAIAGVEEFGDRLR